MEIKEYPCLHVECVLVASLLLATSLFLPGWSEIAARWRKVKVGFGQICVVKGTGDSRNRKETG